MRFLLSNLTSPDNKGRKILRWMDFAKIRDTATWQALLEMNSLEISLEGFDILGHDGLIWVAFILLYRKFSHNPTSIILPQDENQIAFLKYIGFDEMQVTLSFDFANEYLMARRDIAYRTSNEATRKLRRLTLIDGANWSNAGTILGGDIKDFILNKFKIPRIGQEAFSLVSPFTGTLQELIHNIALHGGIEAGNGVGLVSFVPPPARFPIVRYCLTDIGRGFKETLARKLDKPPKTDEAAIIAGLLYRFYYPEDKIIGLYPTLTFIRNRNGVIGIRSGDTLVKLDLSREDAQEQFDKGIDKPSPQWLGTLSRTTKAAYVPGTHIFVDLRLPDITPR